MKSLVLTSQDARELEKFRGLTVTKPIKPAPKYVPGAKLEPADSGREWHLVDESGRRLSRAAVPVEDTFSLVVCAGDVVFIREPWYRLQTPGGGDSDRVILAADSVVGESNVAYKWASPVSMPESAARRFARVKKVEPIYNENVTAWTIELEAISADEAKASEQGAPLSSASDPEDASTYFTYAGDMSAEDHEKMIAAIDADRARLEEVQNRILWIATRRMTIASELKKPVTDPPSVNEIALDGEDRALADELLVLTKEEETLRAALEDAGVPVRTIEDRARERLEEPPEPSEGGGGFPPLITPKPRSPPPRRRTTRRSDRLPWVNANIAVASGASHLRAPKAADTRLSGRQTPPQPVYVTARRRSKTGRRSSASLWRSRRALVDGADSFKRSGPTRPRRRRTIPPRRCATARPPARNAAYTNRSRTLARECNAFSVTTPKTSDLSRSPTRRSASSRTWSK